MGLEVVFDDCLNKKTSCPRLQNYVFYIVAILILFFQLLKAMFLGRNCLRLLLGQNGPRNNF